MSRHAMSAGYERFAEPLTAQFASAAIKLSGGVKPGNTAVDVAAGTGALAVALAKTGASVLATDIAPSKVDRLAERLKPYADATAQIMDGQQLTLPDAIFDKSYSLFGVTLFPDWRRGLKELVRVTRPGGQITIATWVGPDGGGPPAILMPLYRDMFPQAIAHHLPPGLSILSAAATLKDELVRAGCAEVVVHSVEGSWGGLTTDDVMDNIDQMMNWMPLVGALNPYDRSRFDARLRDDIETKNVSKEAVQINVAANIAVCRKAA